MGIYRKKPVEIEAYQWDGSVEGATPLIDWALAYGGTIRFHDEQEAYDDGEKGCPHTPSELSIDTLEGTMSAYEGYWVIRGVKNEFYGCEPTIFAATYEEA